MMARPGRQFAEAEGTQFTAQSLLAERNCKLVKDPLRQIDQPPAYHPVRRWDRPLLDNPRQGLALIGIEQRHLARCLAVDQPVRPLGIERQYPVAHRLQPDPADLGCLAAQAAVVDRCQRQQPPGLAGIMRPPRQPTHLRRRVILPQPNRPAHGKSPLVCHGEAHSSAFGNSPRSAAWVRFIGIWYKLSIFAVAVLVTGASSGAMAQYCPPGYAFYGGVCQPITPSYSNPVSGAMSGEAAGAAQGYATG